MAPCCPVCLETLTARSLVLDCGHKMCTSCSILWLQEKHTCPLCRSLTTTFSRETRSKSRIPRVLNQLNSGLRRAMNMPCECRDRGVLCPIKEIRLVIERLVLREKNIWRRADMQSSLKKIKRICGKMRTYLVGNLRRLEEHRVQRTRFMNCIDVLNQVISF